jgi:hypothetical protein
MKPVVDSKSVVRVRVRFNRFPYDSLLTDTVHMNFQLQTNIFVTETAKRNFIGFPVIFRINAHFRGVTSQAILQVRPPRNEGINWPLTTITACIYTFT